MLVILCVMKKALCVCGSTTSRLISNPDYRICSIRRLGYYLFHRAILCGFYSRAAFIKLSVVGKIFRNCKGFEKSKINEELRCGGLVLKHTFQLDQPPLCYKAVLTRHLQSVSSFSSNDFTWWSPSVPPKCKTSLDSLRSCTCRVYPHAHVLLEYYPRLVFESGDYFVQHVRRCDNNSRAATNRERRLIEQIQYILHHVLLPCVSIPSLSF